MQTADAAGTVLLVLECLVCTGLQTCRDVSSQTRNKERTEAAQSGRESFFTIIWLPRSSLGRGLQERPAAARLPSSFGHTPTQLQRKRRGQKLEVVAGTGFLEDSQLLFRKTFGFWMLLQRTRAGGGGFKTN